MGLKFVSASEDVIRDPLYRLQQSNLLKSIARPSVGNFLNKIDFGTSQSSTELTLFAEVIYIGCLMIDWGGSY